MQRVARTWRENRKGKAEAGLRPGEAPLEGIPGECGAPDAVRGLNYALERRQLSHLWVLFRPHHLKKGFYLRCGSFAALAFEVFGEHGGRSLGDGAAASGEADPFYLAVAEVRVDRHLVAAQGVVEVLLYVRALDLVAVARPLEVVEDYLFVEALHHPGRDCIRGQPAPTDAGVPTDSPWSSRSDTKEDGTANAVRVGIVGDHGPSESTHTATDEALAWLAGEYLRAFGPAP